MKVMFDYVWCLVTPELWAVWLYGDVDSYFPPNLHMSMLVDPFKSYISLLFETETSWFPTHKHMAYILFIF